MFVLVKIFPMNTPTISSTLRVALLCSGMAILISGCNFLRNLTSEPEVPDSDTGNMYSLRRNIADYARKYEGTRYLYAGKSPQTGFDCSGFTSYVMKKYGIELSPSSRDQARQGRPKPVQEARPGDLVFFRRSPAEPVFHVALVVANDRSGIHVIHSTTSRGVVSDNIMESAYWKPKIYSVRDVLGGR